MDDKEKEKSFEELTKPILELAKAYKPFIENVYAIETTKRGMSCLGMFIEKSIGEWRAFEGFRYIFNE